MYHDWQPARSICGQLEFRQLEYLPACPLGSVPPGPHPAGTQGDIQAVQACPGTFPTCNSLAMGPGRERHVSHGQAASVTSVPVTRTRESGVSLTPPPGRTLTPSRRDLKHAVTAWARRPESHCQAAVGLGGPAQAAEDRQWQPLPRQPPRLTLFYIFSPLASLGDAPYRTAVFHWTAVLCSLGREGHRTKPSRRQNIQVCAGVDSFHSCLRRPRLPR